MPFVQSDDVEIFFESHGEGPSILFGHGGGGNAASWFNQVAFFRARYRCIAFDHRGFGRSRWVTDRFAPDLYAKDVRAVLDELDVARTHAVAQSLGALTAVRLALQSPERVQSLVLCNSPLGIADAFAVDKVSEGARRIGRLGAAGVLETFALSSQQDAPLLQAYSAIASFNLDRRPGQATTILAPEILLPVEDLQQIDCPVMCVTGRHDNLVPPEVMHRFATLIPDATCVEFENSGHSQYFEEPDAYNTTVEHFLADADDERPG